MSHIQVSASCFSKKAFTWHLNNSHCLHPKPEKQCALTGIKVLSMKTDDLISVCICITVALTKVRRQFLVLFSPLGHNF